MSKLRQFKDKMQVPLDLKAYKKMEKKELFEEQKKQEDAKHNVYYIKGNFSEYYQEMEILGEGCVGLVKRVKRISDGQIFASKMVKTKDEEEVVLNVIREFKNQRKLHHPNIVEVYELYVDETKGRIYTIMELVQAKEMFDVISKLGQYSERVAAHIFKQILVAIDYLHESMVCHRDLKPNNILCNEDGTCVKITDFNVSKFAHYDNAHKKASNNEDRKQVLMWTYTGTVAFSAPEIFDGDSYDESVDMWSAGVVLFTMLAGHQPFEAEYVQDLIKKIQTCDYTFPSIISENAQDLIKKCLQIDPQQRIKPTEALVHTWIQDKQNSQPLHEASNKISLNLTKLISKFAAYRNLGLIRKINKRKQTFCPSMLYRVRDNPSQNLGSFLNDQEGTSHPLMATQQFNQNSTQEKLNSSFQYLVNISQNHIEQINGNHENPNSRQSYSNMQNQQFLTGGSSRQIHFGFNVLEPLNSQLTSLSDLHSINNLDDEQETASPNKSFVFQERSSRGSEQLNGSRRTRKSAQTNIIHNRYKLNESDQLIVQAIEDDQLSNNSFSQTTQDLSESDQILCYKIYNKLNPEAEDRNKFNKTRFNSLCNIQTSSSNLRISPPRIFNQQYGNTDLLHNKLNISPCRNGTPKNKKKNLFNSSIKSKFASITNFNMLNQECPSNSYQSMSEHQIMSQINIKIRESVDQEDNESEDDIDEQQKIQQDTSLDLIE